MTEAQRGNIVGYLANHREHGDTAHHGGCHGADEDFHQYAYSLDKRITVHPGDAVQAKRYEGTSLWTCLAIRPYRVRNHRMVDICNTLLACPGKNVEERRSGTWMTIRYAKKAGKHIIVFWPDGRVEEINQPKE